MIQSALALLVAPKMVSMLASVEVGSYVSVAKIIPILLVLLLWARLLTWAAPSHFAPSTISAVWRA